MLRENNGYFFLDVLCSFSTFLLLVTLIIPLIVPVSNERRNAELSYQASKVLYEEITQSVYEDVRSNKQKIVGKHPYDIVWNANSVCVSYLNQINKRIEKCDQATP